MMKSNHDENDPDKKKKNDKKPRQKKSKASLLGLGLDSKDEHVRITQGPNFHLVGGSKDTHEQMQETAIKINEELARRRKRLDDVGPGELLDIIHKTK
jgi:hypothetical protein